MTVGDDDGTNAQNFSGVIIRSSVSADFNFFTDTLTFKVRGISFSGFPTEAAFRQLLYFGLLSDSNSSSYNADDAVVVQVRGDGVIRLGSKTNSPNNHTEGNNEHALGDTGANNSLTGFDLTLGPGTGNNISYTITAYGGSGYTASGSFVFDVADWSGAGGNAALQLYAQELNVAGGNEYFTVSVDSLTVETAAPPPTPTGINVVNQAGGVFRNVTLDANGKYTVQFDAGDGGVADKLIVALGTQPGEDVSYLPASITYNGQALILLPATDYDGSRRNKGIWYLDNPYTGGSADLVFDFSSYGTNGADMQGFGYGAISINNSAPGYDAQVNGGYGDAAVQITPTVAGSIVVANFTFQQGTPSVNAPLTPIYAGGPFGPGTSDSNAGVGCAGYVLDVPPTQQSYSAAGQYYARPSAASFAPDTTAPSWTATYPKADTPTTDGFTVRAAINEPGTAYYVVVADAATAPSVAEVKAGTGAGGSGQLASGSIALATANTESTAAVTGLSDSTAYDVYFVAEDDQASPYLQTTVAKADITTATPPSSPYNTWTDSYGLQDPWLGVDPSLNGEPGANADGDSHTNLQEFAFGFDPTVPDGGGELTLSGATITQNGPPQIHTDPVTGQFFLRYTRRADHAAAGLIYTAQFTPKSLDAFEDVTGGSVVATGTGVGGVAIEAVAIEFPDALPVSGRKARFGRVEVTQAP